MARRFAATLALLVALAGCDDARTRALDGVRFDTLASGAVAVHNPVEGSWSRTGAPPWSLVEDLRLGAVDGTGPEVFGSVSGVVPIGDTLIWVYDRQSAELRAFDSTGGHLTTVGRSGEGPGEFGPYGCAHAAPDDEIWVESQGRWQRFAADGRRLGGWLAWRNFNCGPVLWADGAVFTGSSEFGPDLTSTQFLVRQRIEPDGSWSPVDTLPYPTTPPYHLFRWSEGGRTLMSNVVPYRPRPGAVPQRATGRYLVTAGDGYRFLEVGIDGDTTLAIERDFSPVPLSQATRDSAIAALDLPRVGMPDDFDADRIPREHPPFTRMMTADDGSFWIQRANADTDRALDVFDGEGVFLGTLGLPAHDGTVSIQRITGSHLYGVLRDPLGVEFVVRYRIERAGS